jgi:serine/threonine-protein kinase
MAPPVVDAPTSVMTATTVADRYAADGGAPATVMTTAVDDRARQGNGVFIALLVVMLAALVILGYLLGRQLDLFGGNSNSPGTVEIPNVIGQNQAAAETQLKSAGLQVTSQPVANDQVQSGNVFDQDPKGGVKQPKGSTVTIKVSSGSAPVAIPNVVGQDVDDATSALQALQLVVVPRQQPDDNAAAGKVLSTNPPAATSVAKGSTVTLVVSSGKPKVTIPAEIVNTNFNDAAAQLQSIGLVVRRQSQSDSRPIDTVIDANPKPGTQVDKGSTVTLIVSSGEEPTTTTAPTTTTTPTTTPTSSTTSSSTSSTVQ